MKRAFSILLLFGACGAEPEPRPEVARAQPIVREIPPPPGFESPVEPGFEPPAPLLPGGEPSKTPSTPSAKPEPKPVEIEGATAFGAEVFARLEADDFKGLMLLTPSGDGPARKLCPGFVVAGERELEARFRHCRRAIPWDAIEDVRIATHADTRVEAAVGCDDGVTNLGRVRMLVLTKQGRFHVDLADALAHDGRAFAFAGALQCQPVSVSE
jgi:hypothetical protein